MENFWESYMNLVNGGKLISLVVIIAVDWLLGIIIAVKKGEFEFSKIAQYLNTSVLYYIVGYLALGLVALIESSIDTAIIIGAYTTLMVTLVAGLLSKAKTLGLPIPDKVANLISKVT